MLAAMDRMKQHLDAEYGQRMQEQILDEHGPTFTNIGNRVVLIHFLVRAGIVEFLNANAQNPLETVVATTCSRSQVEQFVQVFNERMIEHGRISSAELMGTTRGWVFEMTAQDARDFWSSNIAHFQQPE